MINIVTKKVGWHTIAYVPSVAGKHEPMSKAKAAHTRAELLQRTLAMVFYRCMIASHCGAELLLRDGTKVIVCPRVLLYVCDQPEERSVLGLKQHGSTYDCTPCMARSNASSNIGEKRPRARSVLKTVTAQMRKARLRGVYGMGRTIEDLQTDYSVRCIVPALAGWAGLGSGCFMLYKLPGFDRLHVRTRPHRIWHPPRFTCTLVHCVAPTYWRCDCLLTTEPRPSDTGFRQHNCSSRSMVLCKSTFYCAQQVLDVGLMRIISNEIPVYAETVADGGDLVHGPVIDTMRSCNTRFSYACRTHRVPTAQPGYVLHSQIRIPI